MPPFHSGWKNSLTAGRPRAAGAAPPSLSSASAYLPRTRGFLGLCFRTSRLWVACCDLAEGRAAPSSLSSASAYLPCTAWLFRVAIQDQQAVGGLL